MKITLKQLRKIESLQDLESLNIGRVLCEVGHRGGGIGFYGSDVASAFNVSEDAFGHKFGAACNYLGGGMRGSVFFGGYGKQYVPKSKQKHIDELGAALVRVYLWIENENNMNDEVDESGEINWDAKASNMSRLNGIRSAY